MSGRGAPYEEIEERADFYVAFEGVTEGSFWPKVVPIATPFLGVREVAGCLEFGDDPLGGPFGYANLVGDVAEAGPGCVGYQDEHAGIVGEKGPTAWLLDSHPAPSIARHT